MNPLLEQLSLEPALAQLAAVLGSFPAIIGGIMHRGSEIRVVPRFSPRLATIPTPNGADRRSSLLADPTALLGWSLHPLMTKR
jgi:hypothetical protein